MERLRHRLMPLYSYDPEEDNADWEAELIEDDREQQRALTAIVSLSLSIWLSALEQKNLLA